MLLFGVNKIYASHLPMFRSPNDYQVILELELDEKMKALYLEDKKQNPQETVYTLEPEQFVLPDLVKNPAPFTANVYRGHFERGGKKIIEKITVKVAKVVYFKRFNPEEVHLDYLNFIVLGNEKEQFMAHLISTSPDFDQIVSVKTGYSFIKKSSEAGHFVWLLNGFDNWKALEVSNKTLLGVVQGPGGTVDTVAITPKKNLYLEFNDLK
jgi:hypothetical protein